MDSIKIGNQKHNRLKTPCGNHRQPSATRHLPIAVKARTPPILELCLKLTGPDGHTYQFSAVLRRRYAENLLVKDSDVDANVRLDSVRSQSNLGISAV